MKLEKIRSMQVTGMRWHSTTISRDAVRREWLVSVDGIEDEFAVSEATFMKLQRMMADGNLRPTIGLYLEDE